MWQVYLPIAEVHVSLVFVLAVGVLAGAVAGLFGVGGTFLSIPILEYYGIPIGVTIGSSTLQMVASSAIITLDYWRRKMINLKFGLLTFAGGILGTQIGGKIFYYANSTGQIKLVIAFIYIFMLGSIAILMLRESAQAIRNKRAGKPPLLHNKPVPWILRMPVLLVEDVSTGLKFSALVPMVCGVAAGIVVSLAGIGGGFLLVPAFIYLIRMPTMNALATSNFNGLMIVIISSYQKAVISQSVDIILALLLIVSGAAGSSIGISISRKMPPEVLRLMLAVIMMCLVCNALASLIAPIPNVFSITQQPLCTSS